MYPSVLTSSTLNFLFRTYLFCFYQNICCLKNFSILWFKIICRCEVGQTLVSQRSPPCPTLFLVPATIPPRRTPHNPPPPQTLHQGSPGGLWFPPLLGSPRPDWWTKEKTELVNDSPVSTAPHTTLRQPEVIPPGLYPHLVTLFSSLCV